MIELDVKQKVDQIAECIFDRVQKQEGDFFGLYSGEFGQLLFLLYYTRYSQSKKHALMTDQYSEKLLQRFVDNEKAHTFCSGFSGILYLFEFLRENDFVDFDVSGVQQLLDDYLVLRMRQDIHQKHYDFMHGALGVGLYFLKRKRYPEHIQELIDFLYDTAIKENSNQIFKWEYCIDPENDIIGYNLSLSHGISSIIIFLTRVIKSGLSASEKVFEILNGAVNFLISQQRDNSPKDFYFPHYILKKKSDVVSVSRLAWCYGDLEIGIALWQAGKTTGKIEWKEKGLEILLHATQRRSIVDNNVEDAGVCHGSSGIALIFRRMFCETKLDEFKEAILFWLNQTLKFSNFNDGLAGYKAAEIGGWRCDYFLLTGISGIGLVLISFLINEQQEWDEILLLS